MQFFNSALSLFLHHNLLNKHFPSNCNQLMVQSDGRVFHPHQICEWTKLLAVQVNYPPCYFKFAFIFQFIQWLYGMLGFQFSDLPEPWRMTVLHCACWDKTPTSSIPEMVKITHHHCWQASQDLLIWKGQQNHQLLDNIPAAFLLETQTCC